ncbi:MAG: hypothetical protein F6J95_023435 [Leptolyngbya sp. SIO1E4]|nr:hypothetical protein [Leptolyngbya sp. SIO1E4]
MRLSITLPEGVLAPKYRLFQRVRYTAKPKSTEGVITGMGYISPAVALAEGFGTCGWQYEIRHEAGIGKPLEDLVGKCFEAEIVEEASIEGEVEGVADDA